MGRSIYFALAITLGGCAGILLGYAFRGESAIVGDLHSNPMTELSVLLDGTIRHVNAEDKTVVVDVFDHFRQHREYLVSTEQASLYASELARGAKEGGAASRRIEMSEISEGDVATLVVAGKPGPLRAYTVLIYPGQKERTL